MLRRLSIARVTAVGLGSLALVVLMLLSASGSLNPAETRYSVRPGVSMDGRMPAHSLEDEATGDDADSVLPPNAGPRMNLTGDEVSPALATYGIDRDGNLFEVHSPQTEEPKLAGPIG